MAKTQLKRHDLVYVSARARAGILSALERQFAGAELALAQRVFTDTAEIPGIVRRAEVHPGMVALGFVPAQRLDGRRLRIAAVVPVAGVCRTVTPYAVLQRECALRTACMEAAAAVKLAAAHAGLEAGVLGSAALEIATGLPYTDAASDLDILLRPAPYAALRDFYLGLQTACRGLRVDCELDLPNGYGVKLAEIFMDTRTVLGKSIQDVVLLARQTVLAFLK